MSTESDGAYTPQSADEWNAALGEAETEFQAWQDKSDKVEEQYAKLSRLASETLDRELNLFWANIEVLRPAIYSRPPVPVGSVRFAARDDLKRKAADVIERALITDMDLDDFHGTMKEVRDDLCLPARGAAWVVIEDRDGVDVPSCIHVDRKDFRHGIARKWREVPWVARRAWLTREQWQKRFGKTPPDGVNFQKRAQGSENSVGQKKAEVWEIWCWESRKVYWVCPGCDELLDEQEPMMDVRGFYPCPRPAYGTIQPGSLIPIPDMTQYRSQLEEINELTVRMSALLDALKLRGFYPGGAKDLTEAIETALARADDRAVLIPVSSFAALGGASLRDSIVWLPLQEIAAVIVQCRTERSSLIEDVYQLTGLSDIMRGATDPNETLGAQQLKSQYGSVRVRERQNELSRLALDVFKIKAEVFCEQMPIEDLLELSQVDDIPPEAQVKEQIQKIQQQAAQQIQQLFEQASASHPGAMPDGTMGQGDPQIKAQAEQQIQQIKAQAEQQIQQLMQTVTVEKLGAFLREDKLRTLAIDIETDSTIEPDQQAEKQNRLEFASSIGGFLQQAVPAIQEMPPLAPFLSEALRYVVSGFKVSRSMDEAVDKLAEMMEQFQPPPKEGEGEGAEGAANALAQADVMRAQTEQQSLQLDVQVKQAEMQIKQQEAQVDIVKTQAEIEKIRAETAKIIADANRPPEPTRPMANGGARK